MMRGRRPGDRRDEGSMALELTILGPVLLAFIALLIAYDHHDQVSGTLESGTRDAARAASQARSPEEAADRVQQIVTSSFDQAPPSCRASQSYEITPVGFPSATTTDVTVTMSCSVSYNDLGWPLIPGSVTVKRSFTSPQDPYVGIVP